MIIDKKNIGEQKDQMLSVIIPAYNEEKTLSQVLDRILLLPLKLEVIVVSDGSKDRTPEIIKEYKNKYGIIGIILNENCGKGFAIREGLRYATQPYTIIQDADLEYYPEDYEILLNTIQGNNSIVVYGSRNLPDAQGHKNPFKYFRYWLGGKLVTYFTNILYNAHLTDEATCYKLFPTELLKKMNLQCKGFDFCPEVTAKTVRLGYKIVEVPIKYVPRSINEGKKVRAWHGFEAMLILLKFRFITKRKLFNT
jgi:glycosyltransferase involved in cell wall biosynthesis